MLSVKGITAVGGFFRYGFSLYPLGEDALSEFRFSPAGIMTTIIDAEACACKFSGGFKLKVEEVIMRDGLVVLRPHDNSWQIAFGDCREKYFEWLGESQGLTLAQYKKEWAAMHCKKCGSKLIQHYCSDETCPYHDNKQDKEITYG